MRRKSKKYDADAIKWYEGLDGVRKNPTTYIGSLGKTGIFHLLREVVENSLDEFLANENDYIKVVIDTNEKTIMVVDRGRGIPVSIHKESNLPALTLVMTKLHAGGKFDDNDSAYGASRGVHGLGVSVVNALSSFLEVWTNRNKKWYYQRYEKGKVTCDIKQIKNIKKELPFINKNRGTIVRFSPDQSIFKRASFPTFKEVEEYLKYLAMLNEGLQIDFEYIDQSGHKKSISLKFKSKKGKNVFIQSLLKKNDELIGKEFTFSSNKVKVAFQFSSSDDDERLYSFVSGSITKDGGTHVKGFYDALAKAIRQCLKTKKKSLKFSINDLHCGIIGYVNYLAKGAQFSSQHKVELVSEEAKDVVESELLKPLLAFFSKETKTLNAIANHLSKINEIKRQEAELRKALSGVRKERNSKFSFSGKLVTATTRNPKERELYIVEGDSAGGTAKNARDYKTQEILSLKGKPLNAIKEQNIAKILQNKEVKSILSAIGYDGKKNTFRVGKIIILADADEDGKHIITLVLSLLYRLVPQVYEQKMVYVCKAPLYMLTTKSGKRYFGNSLEELQKLNIKGRVTRMKGWGEINWQTLKEIAFDKKKRELIRIEPIINKNQKVEFLELMGKESKARKELLGI